MSIAMRQDMTFQLTRSADDRISQRGRQRGVQYPLSPFEPRPIKRLKSRRTECADRLIEALGVFRRLDTARVKVPTQILEHARAQRRGELLLKRRLVERDRVGLVERYEQTHLPGGERPQQ